MIIRKLFTSILVYLSLNDQPNAYLKDIDKTGLASAWAMARRKHIWRIWKWRAWRLPGRCPDGGRKSTVARWTRWRDAPAYTTMPDLTCLWDEYQIGVEYLICAPISVDSIYLLRLDWGAYFCDRNPIEIPVFIGWLIHVLHVLPNERVCKYQG